jgi:transposase
MVEMGIDELKLNYRNEKDADVRERILMIIWLKSGISSYKIGERLFCPQSKVIYWKKRYAEHGMDGLRTVQKSGRPTQMDEVTEQHIKEELSSKEYWKSTQVSSIIREKGRMIYTQRHVRRLMQKWGYSLVTPRKKHKKAASDEEVENFKKNPQRYWVLSGRE